MESIIGQPGDTGAENLDLIKESSTATFADDVIKASSDTPILVGPLGVVPVNNLLLF